MIRDVLKSIIYSNKLTKNIYVLYRGRRKYKLYWVMWKLPQFNILRFFRRIGFCDSEYKNLKKYKDIHKGERCFIVATGPSLTIEDLNKLKNERTFGMNSLCKLFDETGWETTYYVVQDIGAFKLLKSDIEKLRNTLFFHGDIWFKKKDLKSLNIKTQKFPRHYEHHGYDQTNFETHFSLDIYDQVYEAYTVAVCTLQIAVYMGFSEIYLVGADCNYDYSDANKSYSVGLNYNGINQVPTRRNFGSKMIYAYSVAKETLDSTDVKVYNATRGGMLEVFPRVNLDEILKEDNL